MVQYLYLFTCKFTHLVYNVRQSHCFRDTDRVYIHTYVKKVLRENFSYRHFDMFCLIKSYFRYKIYFRQHNNKAYKKRPIKAFLSLCISKKIGNVTQNILQVWTVSGVGFAMFVVGSFAVYIIYANIVREPRGPKSKGQLERDSSLRRTGSDRELPTTVTRTQQRARRAPQRADSDVSEKSV